MTVIDILITNKFIPIKKNVAKSKTIYLFLKSIHMVGLPCVAL